MWIRWHMVDLVSDGRQIARSCGVEVVQKHWPPTPHPFSPDNWHRGEGRILREPHTGTKITSVTKINKN